MTPDQSGNPTVGIIMGSSSDWPTMQLAAERLTEFGVAYVARVVSAPRTPHLIPKFAEDAEANGLQVIIAGAGGAAHLPGMMASHTCLPVLGVPIQSKALQGLDSLLSIVQMPDGIPVGTLAIGQAGAKNAAMMAIAILALHDAGLAGRLKEFRRLRSEQIEREELSQ